MSRGGPVSVVTGMVAMVVLGTMLSAAAAAAPIVLPRPGQVGFGGGGGVGLLRGTGDPGGLFEQGPTFAFRLRYRMRYERALGLSFESQRFDIKALEAEYPVGSGLQGRKNLTLVLSGVELSQLFGTRTRATKMLFVGAGLAQGSGRTQDNGTWFPGDGSYVSAGVGVEYFFMRSWAWDLSGRYALVFLPDQRLHDFQAALGVILYASY